MGREQLVQAVHDNLRNLSVEVLDVVNLRSMLRDDGPDEGSLEGPVTVMADLQRQGLIRHVGLWTKSGRDTSRFSRTHSCRPAHARRADKIDVVSLDRRTPANEKKG
jgi:aryl-alcohol dehydrogenase-like predicted oxidoreductase